MLNELNYIHLLALWPWFMQGMIALLSGHVKPLSIASLYFFFSLAYLILLLLSCINILICTDLLIPSITTQLKGTHNAWFPFS